MKSEMEVNNPKKLQDADYGMGWELFGRKAYRQGDWNTVLTPPPFGNKGWVLYNPAQDPTDT